MTIEIIKPTKQAKPAKTRKKALQKDYIIKKASAVSQYLQSNQSTREIAKATWIAKSVVQKAVNQEVKQNLSTYKDILDDARENISSMIKDIKDNKGNLKYTSNQDILIVTEIALKHQKLVNMIEWVSPEWDKKNTPNIINIQVNNYKDTE